MGGGKERERSQEKRKTENIYLYMCIIYIYIYIHSSINPNFPSCALYKGSLFSFEFQETISRNCFSSSSKLWLMLLMTGHPQVKCWSLRGLFSGVSHLMCLCLAISLKHLSQCLDGRLWNGEGENHRREKQLPAFSPGIKCLLSYCSHWPQNQFVPIVREIIYCVFLWFLSGLVLKGGRRAVDRSI